MIRSRVAGIAFASVLATSGSLLFWAEGCGNANDSLFDGGSDGDGGSGEGSMTFDETGLGDARGCVNLQCAQDTCTAGVTTNLTGTVYDPAGKVPLYNAVVYVPNSASGVLDPISTGASCDKCGVAVSGFPLVTALTDARGRFTLKNVPHGANIPLVVQIGKWRREVHISNVTACVDTPVDVALTRLPRNKSEGNIPKIALTTGGADPLECLLRKIGIDDSEFTTESGSGRINLYGGYGHGTFTDAGTDGGTVNGSSQFTDGGAFTSAATVWSDYNRLKNYDIVLMACEGNYTRDTNTKPQAALDAMFQYASNGGRVFASHYHDYWFAKGPAPFPSTGHWLINDCTAGDVNCYGSVGLITSANSDTDASVDTTFPKGQALSDWLVNVGASPVPGYVQIEQAKTTITSVNSPGVDAGAQRWLSAKNFPTPLDSMQYITFNTPIQVPDDQKCGRVVYSDLHVSGSVVAGASDVAGQPFPSGCHTTDLSPQEKALEFMLFDLSSCIQNDQTAPQPPPK